MTTTDETRTWTANAVGGRDGTPAMLFHGTDPGTLDAIRREGLRPFEPDYWGPGCEPTAVYLTESLQQAAANALKRLDPRPRRLDPRTLLVVDVTDLPLLVLGFVTCFAPIGPERITDITAYPALRRRLRRESGW